MKKILGKELIVFWFSMTAMICAAISLNDSLKRLVEKDHKNDMERGQ